MKQFSRRDLLRAAAMAPAAVVAPLQFFGPGAGAARADERSYENPHAGYLTRDEIAFVDAAVARIIPKDELGPGALEAGVTTFIDRQLAGPYGRAETWYMQGPWREGIEQQGYQLKLTPAQLYRAAIRAIDAKVKAQHGGKTFAQLDPAAQDAVLDAIDKDQLQITGAPVRAFFEMLVRNTVEGFLADPIYGGNRDFIGWKLIGFPGPRYNYVAEIEQYGKKYDMPFVSIGGVDSGVRKA
ncbi:MAG TPA: gluconate 2-dehydrogenase subunit 3 family protein [Casimicrobiaceae bacterium]|nr:gluconate 2-dehydrogenase subunit 3 family protein [Casimicrobiaceae bacterium]